MNTLILGGTSGLGLEMAKMLRDEGHTVCIPGRHDPEVRGLRWRHLDFNVHDVDNQAKWLCQNIPPTDACIYAPGFFQKGKLTELEPEEIERMINVGGRGLIYVVRQLLINQGKLEYLAVMGSTSQRIPRPEEPVYNFVKSGSWLLAKSLANTGQIAHTLHAELSGMNTPFWEGTFRDTTGMLEPEWVAEGVLKELLGDDTYLYKDISAHRETEHGPQRIVVNETWYPRKLG